MGRMVTENVMQRVAHAALWMLIALPLAGCPRTVVRDSKVFKAEMGWFTSAALQQANALTHFMVTHPQCKCDEAKTKFTDPKCQKTAKLLLTALHRAPWHRDMALFNAGHLETRPTKTPPVIPDVSVLCDGEVD